MDGNRHKGEKHRTGLKMKNSNFFIPASKISGEFPGTKKAYLLLGAYVNAN
jgi:hypothetical protein